jgi:hypothetical protein
MKYYKTKNAEVGTGVEAIVMFRNDKTGEELICVKSGSVAFEKQNKKAKECSQKDADKFLAKAKLKFSVPTKVEIREAEQLSDEEILQEIENKKTATVNIAKEEIEDKKGKRQQKLKFFEEVEIKSTEEFFNAQIAQKEEPEAVVIDEETAESVST